MSRLNNSYTLYFKSKYLFGKVYWDWAKYSDERQSEKWVDFHHPYQVKLAAELFQRQLQKNLCECYIQCVGVIRRPYGNIGCCLSGSKNLRDWRCKMVKWSSWTWSCERSNKNHQSSGPTLCGLICVYSLLCQYRTGKHCIKNREDWF